MVVEMYLNSYILYNNFSTLNIIYKLIVSYDKDNKFIFYVLYVIICYSLYVAILVLDIICY